MKRSLNKVHKDQQNIEFNETIILALVLRNYLHSKVLFNFNPFVPNANTADKSKISQISETDMASSKKDFFFKACVRYFLSNLCFSPNDCPLKTMKNFVPEIFKFLYFRLPFFFLLSAIA